MKVTILIKKGRSIFLILCLIIVSFLQGNYCFAQPRRVMIFCLDMIMKWNQHIQLGCEVIDCCIGCPKKTIDIHFLLKAQDGISLILNFELPDQDLRRKIKINGNASWLNEKQLQVLPGEINISGIPFNNKGFINPEYRITKKFKEARDRFARLNPYPSVGSLDITTELLIRKFVSKELVLEEIYFSVFRPCLSIRPPVLAFDVIQVNGNSDNDNLLILSDGKRFSNPLCSDDEEYRTQNSVGVGNYISPAVCNAETIVFSFDNAMNIKTSADIWTNNTGDIHRVSLSPLLDVPVFIWMLATVPRAGQINVINQIKADVETANLLFNSNRAGIQITAEYCDISSDPLAMQLLESFECTKAQNILASRYFIPGKINIYYTNSVLDRGVERTGVCCWVDDNQQPFHPELIGVSPISVMETLTHELGHSFFLDHINQIFCSGITCNQGINCSGGILALGTENIMYGGASNRSKFTLGQAYRINVNNNSTLNTLGFRTGVTRPCGTGCNETCIRFDQYFIW